MDNLINIKNKSLVSFPVPKQSNYINDHEMLEHMKNLYSSLDSHLGISYEGSEQNPFFKINSKGYCYIYFPAFETNTDRKLYFKQYKKILNNAKKNNCKKFVLVFRGSIHLTNAFCFFYPFINTPVVTKTFFPGEDIAKECSYVSIFNNSIRTLLNEKTKQTINIEIFSFPIKVKCDKLVVFFNEANKTNSIFLQKVRCPVEIYVDKLFNKSANSETLMFGIKNKNEQINIQFIVKWYPSIPLPELKYVDSLPSKYLPNA